MRQAPAGLLSARTAYQSPDPGTATRTRDGPTPPLPLPAALRGDPAPRSSRGALRHAAAPRAAPQTPPAPPSRARPTAGRIQPCPRGGTGSSLKETLPPRSSRCTQSHEQQIRRQRGAVRSSALFRRIKNNKIYSSRKKTNEQLLLEPRVPPDRRPFPRRNRSRGRVPQHEGARGPRGAAMTAAEHSREPRGHGTRAATREAAGTRAPHRRGAARRHTAVPPHPPGQPPSPTEPPPPAEAPGTAR